MARYGSRSPPATASRKPNVFSTSLNQTVGANLYNKGKAKQSDNRYAKQAFNARETIGLKMSHGATSSSNDTHALSSVLNDHSSINKTSYSQLSVRQMQKTPQPTCMQKQQMVLALSKQASGKSANRKSC